MSIDGFARIPAGRFLMGENPDDKFANDTERPRREVNIAAFDLGIAPVTIGSFRRFRPGHEGGHPDDWPACQVSWDDANAYCAWLGGGFRLPTEAEWEYAARAGAESPYPWGDTITPDDANYLYDEQGRKVGPGSRMPVGSYPANAFGVVDMIGNVCEWVADVWHPGYCGAPSDGSARAGEGSRRVLRGGAWDYLPRLLRCSWRDGFEQFARRDNVGFRLARDL